MPDKHLTIEKECVVQPVALQKVCGAVSLEVGPGEAAGGADDERDDCAPQPERRDRGIDAHREAQEIQRQRHIGSCAATSSVSTHT